MILPVIPIETFFDPSRAAEVWPDCISCSKEFISQIELRKALNQRLSAVLDALPQQDMHLNTAIRTGYISEVQAAELYDSLGMLIMDDDYKRLLLYLPFEFLPQSTWKPSQERLQRALKSFAEIYKKIWQRLLWVHDVRANFVDGDVLESECRAGDLPRVVKAAHLIPKLVEAGLMSIKDVMVFMEESRDPILKASIEDALCSIGLKSRRETEKIMTDMSGRNVTKKRKAWLKRMERQKVIGSLVEGIRKAVEKDPALYAQYEATLSALWEDDDPDVREALLKAFRRFHRLGIIDSSILDELHITIPKLAGPFSENLKFMAELPDIQRMAMSVKSNTELSQFIYPVVLAYGSRLNGYGRHDADIDLAVFVRPGMPFHSIQLRLQALLRRTFAHKNIHVDDIIEFWLEEKDDKLKVRDLGGNTSTGESSWVHVLFGAAWIGDKDNILGLCRKLLVPYMMVYDRYLRSLYLEQMERSFLQYRLLHNGYERFFPPCGGINLPQTDAIDGKSMFWDSGYRRLATRLFVSRVFLPKVCIHVI